MSRLAEKYELYVSPFSIATSIFGKQMVVDIIQISLYSHVHRDLHHLLGHFYTVVENEW